MIKLKHLQVIALFAIPMFHSCTDVDKIEPAPSTVLVPTGDVTDFTIVDKQATPETKALFANLWQIQQTGYMFGHQDDLTYGRYWEYEDGNSDTKQVCGDYPGVYGIDFAPLMDDRLATSDELKTVLKRSIQEARTRGEVILACVHLNNPLTGGDAWDNSNNQVAKEILTNGSATQIKFNSWLDNLVSFAAELKDANGNPIPVIFRPFHEHTEAWSWWGNQCTSEQEFIDLWQYTVNYLRTAGVHQFLYAISPQMDTPKTEADFAYRWPGDDYVDFIGMDCYNHGIPTTMSVNLRMLQSVAAKKKKPCGITETGIQGFSDAKYWTEQVLAPAEGRKISMIVMWRNDYSYGDENNKEFYSVYPGHSSVDNFIRFYDNPQTLFSSDLPNMYAMPAGITVN